MVVDEREDEKHNDSEQREQKERDAPGSENPNGWAQEAGSKSRTYRRFHNTRYVGWPRIANEEFRRRSRPTGPAESFSPDRSPARGIYELYGGSLILSLPLGKDFQMLFKLFVRGRHCSPDQSSPLAIPAPRPSTSSCHSERGVDSVSWTLSALRRRGPIWPSNLLGRTRRSSGVRSSHLLVMAVVFGDVQAFQREHKWLLRVASKAPVCASRSRRRFGRSD